MSAPVLADLGRALPPVSRGPAATAAAGAAARALVRVAGMQPRVWPRGLPSFPGHAMGSRRAFAAGANGEAGGSAEAATQVTRKWGDKLVVAGMALGAASRFAGSVGAARALRFAGAGPMA